jgi:hypothetical protein
LQEIAHHWGGFRPSETLRCIETTTWSGDSQSVNQSISQSVRVVTHQSRSKTKKPSGSGSTGGGFEHNIASSDLKEKLEKKDMI